MRRNASPCFQYFKLKEKKKKKKKRLGGERKKITIIEMNGRMKVKFNSFQFNSIPH